MSTEYLSKSDLVANGIRALIQNGDLLPGSVLPQRELAERFRVSPTPVREALRQLEAEGFVTTEPHRGAAVVHAGDARLEENFLIRANLESLGAALAAQKATDEDLSELELIVEKMAACSPFDPGLADLNAQFHFRIYEAARSPMLLSLLRLLWRSLGGGPRVSRHPDESLRQHRQLLKALRRRDADAAAEQTRRHIMSAYQSTTARASRDGKPGGR